MDQNPHLMCLTPVKNEAWVFQRHLECASLWADTIVVADQQSVDGTREIAERFPKVRLVENRGQGYDEGERQRLVFEEARRVPGTRVLLAIDSDEVVTANWMTSPEWRAVRCAEPGTVIRFQWVNLLPGCKKCWIPPEQIPMGFVDDGVREHSAGQFHVPRLPVPEGAPEIVMQSVKVLHYQYVNWARMKSKQHRYMCYERVHNPRKRAVTLYRQYHHMDAIPAEQIKPVDPEWFAGYEGLGIDMTSTPEESVYPPDREVIDLLLEHGTERFRKLNIWDVDWAAKARAAGIEAPEGALADPRSPFEKRIHRWLGATQARKFDIPVRVAQNLLRAAGW